MKYRVFTNDIGPNQFSCLRDITAHTLAQAKGQARQCIASWETKALVVPHSHPDLWPDSKTGTIKPEAEAYIVTR